MEGFESHTKVPSGFRTSASSSSFVSRITEGLTSSFQKSSPLNEVIPLAGISCPPPPSSTARMSGAPKSDSPMIPQLLHHLTTLSPGRRNRNQPVSWKSSTVVFVLLCCIRVQSEPNCAVPCANSQQMAAFAGAASWAACLAAPALSSASAAFFLRSSLAAFSSSDNTLATSLSTTLLMTRIRFGSEADRLHAGHSFFSSKAVSRQEQQNTCSSRQQVWASTTRFLHIEHRYSSHSSSAFKELPLATLSLSSNITATSAAVGLWLGSTVKSISTTAPILAFAALHSVMVLLIKA
mmetsp:Transcript_30978/g.48549  ORF Transcript_30978/g.48549 Transcript_30978/m.48549 type:complete len:294 (+) Transcript_30978:422-1303(+)